MGMFDAHTACPMGHHACEVAARRRVRDGHDHMIYPYMAICPYDIPIYGIVPAKQLLVGGHLFLPGLGLGLGHLFLPGLGLQDKTTWVPGQDEREGCCEGFYEAAIE